jgi:hypothetical protein
VISSIRLRHGGGGDIVAVPDVDFDASTPSEKNLRVVSDITLLNPVVNIRLCKAAVSFLSTIDARPGRCCGCY